MVSTTGCRNDQRPDVAKFLQCIRSGFQTKRYAFPAQIETEAICAPRKCPVLCPCVGNRFTQVHQAGPSAHKPHPAKLPLSCQQTFSKHILATSSALSLYVHTNLAASPALPCTFTLCRVLCVTGKLYTVHARTAPPACTLRTAGWKHAGPWRTSPP